MIYNRHPCTHFIDLTHVNILHICLRSFLNTHTHRHTNMHRHPLHTHTAPQTHRVSLPRPLRIHIEEINHMVLLHMTERMGYKHSEVLSAVLTNRACHTLAVYFLINNKMKRISKEYRVSRRPLTHTLTHTH